MPIEIGPENASWYYRLGFALQQAEDYEPAFVTFEKAILSDPALLDAYYQNGRTAVFSASNLERAADFLHHYLEQPHHRSSPGPEHAHWRLGMIYELQGKRDEAADEYRAALAIDPKHTEAKKALKALG